MLSALTPVLPYLFGIAFIYIAFEAYAARDKIWCSFRRKDRTKIYKWAKKTKDGTWDDIEFDGGLYHVEPGRTVFMWKMCLGFIPLGVRGADFRHDSARALNPDTFDNSYTPDERKQLNIADDVRDFANGNANAMGGKMKKSMLDALLPIIIIAGFAVLGYLMFQQGKNINMIGNGQNLMEQQIDIIKKQVGGK